MKIKTLTLNNFRGFPGPIPQSFQLDGRNLLVYGENGSGKSSIYHALKTFFTLQHPIKPDGTVHYQGEACNVFSGSFDHWIEVEFDDGAAVRWVGPPVPASWTSEDKVIKAATLRGCLDYRAILDTNYGHGSNKINLFDLAVNVLLADFEVPVSGGSATIAELWANVNNAKPDRHNARVLTIVETACITFNQGFNQALTAIRSQTDALLKELPVEGMTLNNFSFLGVTYNPTTRSFEGKTLEPEISLRGYTVDYPQHFINEARLSAIGLAIYLAGRLTCVPTGGDYLKLLVLDDVLIGIDLSNRLPLLDLLVKNFADWQIVLLTYDKTWFDVAWIRLEDSKAWTTVSVFEGATDGPFTVPIVVPKDKSAVQVALDKAKDFLAEHEYQPAANYARSAFESTLKLFCEKRNVPVPFNPELRDMSSEDFLDAITKWTAEDAKRIFYSAVLERARLFRRIILNPLSHADAPAVRSEVEGAIAAVEALANLPKYPPQHPKLLDEVRSIVANAAPTQIELQTALANLRAKFAWLLYGFCERYQVEVPFKVKQYDTADLWDIVFAKGPTLFMGGHVGLEAQINAERKWLVDDLEQDDLKAFAVADITRILGILCPAANEKLVFDGIMPARIGSI